MLGQKASVPYLPQEVSENPANYLAHHLPQLRQVVINSSVVPVKPGVALGLEYAFVYMKRVNTREPNDTTEAFSALWAADNT